MKSSLSCECWSMPTVERGGLKTLTWRGAGKCLLKYQGGNSGTRSLPIFSVNYLGTHGAGSERVSFCSYVLVIQQLPEVIQDPICINYLVLRGLDTLQDDQAIPAEKRVPLLLDYYKHIGDRCCTALRTRIRWVFSLYSLFQKRED
jgi:hypothetical protein